MSQRELAALILRAIGLYVLIRGLERIDWFVSWIKPRDDTLFRLETSSWVTTAVGLVPIALVLLGALLLILAPRLTGLLVSRPGGAGPEDHTPFTTGSLFAAGSALVGVVLVLDTIPVWIELVLRLVGATQEPTFLDRLFGSRTTVGLFARLLLQVAFGIGLFVRGPALFRFWVRIQRAVARADSDTGPSER
jgi:hypothetical protein